MIAGKLQPSFHDRVLMSSYTATISDEENALFRAIHGNLMVNYTSGVFEEYDLYDNWLTTHGPLAAALTWAAYDIILTFKQEVCFMWRYFCALTRPR